MSQFETERSNKMPLVVWVVSFGIFLLGTTEFMVAGLLPQLADDLSVTQSGAGLLVSAFAVGMVIGAPLMTMTTLRLPRRTTLVAALLVFAAGHVVAALSSDFGVVLATRVVTAFATGTYWAVGAVVVTGAVADTQRARALGLLVGGLTLANVAGVPLGTYVGDVTGWRGPFWGLAAFAALVAVAVAKVVPATNAGVSTSFRSEFTALRSRRMWIALLIAALGQGGLFAAFSYVSPLLTDRAGLPASLVPLVLVLFGFGALLGSTLGGRLGDAHPVSALAASLTTTVTTLALLGFGPPNPAVTVALLAVLGIGGFTLIPVLASLALRYAPGAPTLASSLSTSAFNVGNAAGPWLGGIALDSTLTARGPSVAGTGLALLAALVAVPFAATIKRRPATSEPAAAQPTPAGVR